MKKNGAGRNGLWGVAQQFANLGFNGVFAIVIARFVSVEDFGLFNYALTLASLGMAVMASGLYGLAVREYFARPSAAVSITAAIVFIREAMAVIAYVVLVGISATSASGITVLATAIACLAIFARVFDAPSLWFQANLRTNIPALVRIVVGAIFFLLRIGLILWMPNIILFVVIFVIEQIVSSASVFTLFVRNVRQKVTLRPERAEVKKLSLASLPLIISTVANQVNLKADIVILQAIRGSTTVGIYSAAARLSELAYTLPVAYMTATFPRMLSARERFGSDSAAYRLQLQRAFDGAFWFGMLLVAATLVFGDTAILLLFGPEYSDAVPILKIHILACPFVFMAAVFSKWIIAENLLWLSLGRHICGAAITIVLNFLLAPTYGGVGSAVATVVSYTAASYVFCFLTGSTRSIAKNMSLAMIAPARLLLSIYQSKRGKSSN